jgi:predicted extracellular nuclease
MRILIALFCTVFALQSEAQKNRTIAFYNVENLFDTIDGPNDDAEFLPDSKNQWNTQKYFEKIDHLNKVMDQFNEPLIVGFCEIENASVIRDLNMRSANRKNYGLVHFESPDARGIDVAMTYDSTTLTLLKSGFIRYTLPGQSVPSTRDIVWGKFALGKDTIIGLVNHWPSRRSGQTESEPNRLEAAKQARSFIDSLLNINPNYKVFLMGDLNDYPTDKAPQMIAEKLKPMITPKSGEYGGTYNYNGEWDVLDHIFVSNGMVKKKGIKAKKNSGKIYSEDFMLSEFKGNRVPFRTYGGSKYLGGYSDHLPVSIEVSVP